MSDKHSFISAQSENAPLFVYNVGYEKCAPLHKWGLGVRDHYIIHHIVSGKGIYFANGKEYELCAGNTFIIYPRTEIYYAADKDDPWAYYWAGFSGSEAESLLERTDFSRDYPVISADFGDELKNSIESIYNFRGHSTADSVRMTGQLYITLGLLIDKAVDRRPHNSKAASCVKKAVRYMKFNYAMDIGIEQAAEYAQVSRATLYRAFMETKGISPIAYLTEIRINNAVRLLESTSLPISAVARSAGFEDPLYFSRVFKKHKGISPAEYKNTFEKQVKNKENISEK